MKTIIIILTIFITAIGTFSQRTYIWSGAVNSNFSTAGNWNPVRQVGLATDKLVFNNGTTLDITNVYQVTIGQLSVLNNSHIKFSPTPGNPKIIFIQGNGDTNGSNKPGGNEFLADLKYNEYMNSETQDYSDVKYNEYMRTDSSELAAIKYNEYMRSDSTDLAALKYNEYRKPAVTGMGDVKEESGFDSKNNDDLFIDTGSSLTICGNDPKLSVFLKQNATACIKGSLIFTGSAENEINSSDPFAISFREGSTLIQSCPGHIFSGSGTLNSINFENGSKLVINHSGVLDPFGMVHPASKVNFESSSFIEFNLCGPNSLALNGRHFPNLIINNKCNIDVREILTSDITMNNLDINSGGKLFINNLAENSIPNLNVKGDITVNGELHFPENPNYKFNLNINGGNNQYISGNGIINLNTGINTMHIYNDLTLNRDLSAYCPVNHHGGYINTNGYTFKLYNQYTSNQPLFVGMIIIPKHFVSSNNSDKQVPKGNGKLAGNTVSNTPSEFSISQNFPNPFNPKTKINYAVPNFSKINISIFDLTGKKVASLVNASRESNLYTVEFDGSDYASGIYFYRFIAEGASGVIFSKTMKMSLIK